MGKNNSNRSKQHCFITGGTGFIGRRLTEKLINDGFIVHLLVRESSDLAGLDSDSIIFHKGSLLDEEFLIASLKGCQYLFHLAGYAKNWSKDNSIYYLINVEGTKTIASAALKADVKRFIYCSSIVALGATDQNKFQEENYNPQDRIFYTEYEKTKKNAEDEALGFVDRGLDIVIVNPARVYGPGLISESNSLTLMIKNYLKWKFCLILGKGSEGANYVYVDDVVDGMILAASHGKKGEKYILGGENSSLENFFRKTKKVCGKRAIHIHVPVFLAMVIAGFQEFLAKHFNRYPLITKPWIETFLQNWLYTSQKAEKELGYKPHNLEEGLRKTIDWLSKK